MKYKLIFMGTAVVLAGCGGGGSDTASNNTQTTPDVYPAAKPAVGDWFVYTSTTTPTLPAGQTPIQRTIVRYFPAVNADGSLTRVDTTSLGSRAQRSFDANRAIVSFTSASSQCNFVNPYRSAPPLASKVGDTYTANSTQFCTALPSGIVSQLTIAITGSSVAIEDRIIPLGTFRTFKYTQTTVSTSATSTVTNVESCWTDMVSGQTVECTTTSQTVPAGQSAVTASGSSSVRLEAYSFNNQAAVGSAVQRFSGLWNVALGGATTGDCLNLFVADNGQISGACRLLVSAGVYGASFPVTGTVNAAGVVALTATNGATISGAFSSPVSAGGAWQSGAVAGIWAASHL
ncbi:MAG: hypothetical protein AB9M53_07425 [Leptothrix sp. (in: b-proteobacteria)]